MSKTGKNAIDVMFEEKRFGQKMAKAFINMKKIKKESQRKLMTPPQMHYSPQSAKASAHLQKKRSLHV